MKEFFQLNELIHQNLFQRTSTQENLITKRKRESYGVSLPQNPIGIENPRTNLDFGKPPIVNLPERIKKPENPATKVRIPLEEHTRKT